VKHELGRVRQERPARHAAKENVRVSIVLDEHELLSSRPFEQLLPYRGRHHAAAWIVDLRHDVSGSRACRVRAELEAPRPKQLERAGVRLRVERYRLAAAKNNVGRDGDRLLRAARNEDVVGVDAAPSRPKPPRDERAKTRPPLRPPVLQGRRIARLDGLEEGARQRRAWKHLRIGEPSCEGMDVLSFRRCPLNAFDVRNHRLVLVRRLAGERRKSLNARSLQPSFTS